MSFLTLYHFATKVWVCFIVYSVFFLFFINFLPILQAISFIHMHIHLTPFCPKAHIQTHLHKRAVFNLTSTPHHTTLQNRKNILLLFFHTPTNIILLYMYVCLSVFRQNSCVSMFKCKSLFIPLVYLFFSCCCCGRYCVVATATTDVGFYYHLPPLPQK